MKKGFLTKRTGIILLGLSAFTISFAIVDQISSSSFTQNLLPEAIGVFFGVLLAFSMQETMNARDDRRKAADLKAALLIDLKNAVNVLSNPFPVVVDTDSWDMGKSTGIFILLDDYFRDVVRGIYSNIAQYNRMMDSYRILLILPMTGHAKEENKERIMEYGNGIKYNIEQFLKYSAE